MSRDWLAARCPERDGGNLGYDIVEVSKGRVVATAIPHEGRRNPAGGCSTVAWVSLWGVAQTTVEFKITLVRPITPDTGLIKAEGVVLNCGRRIGIAEGRITDQKGRLLAHGTTTCLIFESQSNVGRA